MVETAGPTPSRGSGCPGDDVGSPRFDQAGHGPGQPDQDLSLVAVLDPGHQIPGNPLVVENGPTSCDPR
jgi:hypothetical protein